MVCQSGSDHRPAADAKTKRRNFSSKAQSSHESASLMNSLSSVPEISVVVPVYNEEENIAILQSELAAALGGTNHEIVFVDDGSTDQTASKITSSPVVRVIRFEQNRGQSAAIYAGAHAARGQ